MHSSKSQKNTKCPFPVLLDKKSLHVISVVLGIVIHLKYSLIADSDANTYSFLMIENIETTQ